MKATTRYLHIAPRKVRRVADLIRNKSVPYAVTLLRFSKQKPAEAIAKTLKSAAANAKQTTGKDPESLYVYKITVDPGPVFRRHQPKWRGIATPIRKKTSHVSIMLAERTTKKTI